MTKQPPSLGHSSQQAKRVARARAQPAAAVKNNAQEQQGEESTPAADNQEAGNDAQSFDASDGGSIGGNTQQTSPYSSTVDCDRKSGKEDSCLTDSTGTSNNDQGRSDSPNMIMEEKYWEFHG
ncbi:hypothetical protein QFC19_000156 [Naganishia cerealis]|uniref:Uncharacterized protein n=1 Tax=Naganishia cerealis TaxID=610337 RepID=A0ACC2WRM2_9TREE|nr:hypothetical protein QFC19_000156 [Naganishia cerealis]